MSIPQLRRALYFRHDVVLYLPKQELRADMNEPPHLYLARDEESARTLVVLDVDR